MLSAPPCSVEELVFKPCIALHVRAKRTHFFPTSKKKKKKKIINGVGVLSWTMAMTNR